MYRGAKTVLLGEMLDYFLAVRLETAMKEASDAAFDKP